MKKNIAETALLYSDVFFEYLGTLANSPIFGARAVFPCAESRELVDSAGLLLTNSPRSGEPVAGHSHYVQSHQHLAAYGKARMAGPHIMGKVKT